MDTELFDIEHFNMVIRNILEIKTEIRSLKEIQSDIIKSALDEDRNLDEFEVLILNYLETIINEDEEKLKIFYKHIRAEVKD